MFNSRSIKLMLTVVLFGGAALLSYIATAGASENIAAELTDADLAPPSPAVIIDRARVIAGTLGDADQIKVLSDGTVTVDEYVRATRETIGCLTNDGFEIIQLGYDWTGTVYDYGAEGPDGVDQRDAAKRFDQCYDESSAVDYAHQMLLESYRGQLAELTAECLEAAGVRRAEVVQHNGVLRHPFEVKQVADARDGTLWPHCVQESQGQIAVPVKLPDVSALLTAN